MSFSLYILYVHFVGKRTLNEQRTIYGYVNDLGLQHKSELVWKKKI